MDYIFTEGTSAPYEAMYDTTEGAGPNLIAEVPTTGTAGARKLMSMNDGTLYIVYTQSLNDKLQIFVMKSVDDGATWTDETRISTYATMDVNDQNTPCIAVDSDDHLHVLWSGTTTDSGVYPQLWYSEYNISWSAPIYLTPDAGNLGKYHPSLAIDSNDVLQIVTWGPPGAGQPSQIYYVNYTSSWGSLLIISTYAGMVDNDQAYPTIEIDGNNYLHVAWRGEATGYTENQVWYRRYTTEWGTVFRISSHTAMSSYWQDGSTIAIDSDNYVHVSWTGKAVDFTGFNQVWYRRYTTEWEAITRISTYTNMDDYHQYVPSIGVNTNDSIHVLWHGKATGFTNYDKVWHVLYNGTWQTPECLQPTGQNKAPNIRWSRWPEVQPPEPPPPPMLSPQYPVWFPLVLRLLGILAPFAWMAYEFTNITDFKSGLRALGVTFVGFILFIVVWYVAGGLEEVIMQYD